jgi:predicted metal-dependent hydrolase
VKTLNFDGLDVPVELRKYTNAKNLSIKVSRGKVLVSVPKYVPYKIAEQFVVTQIAWIEEQLAKSSAGHWLPEHADYKKDKTAARKLVAAKLEYWNKFYDFEWGRVAIRDQSTRWGSCSSKRNLNFTWKTLHLPEHLQDYLIVHELCHLENPNHSKKFWSAVAETLPNYKALRKELKSLSL